MRSFREVAFRLRQEARNLKMLAAPPRYNPGKICALPRLPPMPEAVSGEIANLARQIREHRFPVLGTTIDFGPEICWRRDYKSGRETPAKYFRRISYLDPQRAGD